tara:strand:+ start:2774 stop:3037 length:264 start_codon:yes stop_codon:yes gene_type:complete
MAIGTVKWFNNAKGYGFLSLDGSNEDVFIHFSSIHMDGYKTLKAGDPVEFELNKGPKGLHALDTKLFGQQATEESVSVEMISEEEPA